MTLLLQKGLLVVELVLLGEFRLQVDFDFGSVAVGLELDSWRRARGHKAVLLLESKLRF